MVNGILHFVSASEESERVRQSNLRREYHNPDPITGIGMARLNQVEGLPCAGPAIRVFTILSKRGRGYRVTEVATACDIPVRG